MNTDTSKYRIFYGWYVLAASFLLLFFQSGARFSFGVMFKPMISQLGWDRASISSAFFLNMIVFALTLSVAGKFYDRYGPKWIIFISTLFISCGYGLIAFIRSLWEFQLYYGIVAALGMGGASVPLIAALMSKWFQKHRGLAISLALSGNCIGQFILVPIFTDVVLRFGWQLSYLIIGVTLFVTNTVLVLAVFKGSPDELGLKPFGAKDSLAANRDQESIVPTTTSDDLSLWGAMHTASFWLFLFVMFICGSGDFLVATHLIPLVTDYDVSPIEAGKMMAWFGLMGMGGILIAGPVSDRIGNKIPIACTFLIRFVLFLLIIKYQTRLSFYIFALLFGFTFLITAPLTVTLSGKLYGFTHIGLLSGFITTVHHLGGGFWAYMGGLIFDRTGSYRACFVMSAAMALIAFCGSILIQEKRH